MSIRFQADADLNHKIVRAVVRSEPAIDFQTASEAGIRGLSDPDVLAFAAVDGRMLVTHDRKTMLRHFAEFIATNTSPGVFIVSQSMPIATSVEELILIWSASDPDEWINKIVSLPI